jgi:hypothetical protein
MTRSKFIPVILAVFCGVAVQFKVSGANAQTFTVVPSGAYANYVNPADGEYWGFGTF